jgi:hypothetical protein
VKLGIVDGAQMADPANLLASGIATSPSRKLPILRDPAFAISCTRPQRAGKSDTRKAKDEG